MGRINRIVEQEANKNSKDVSTERNVFNNKFEIIVESNLFMSMVMNGDTYDIWYPVFDVIPHSLFEPTSYRTVLEIVSGAVFMEKPTSGFRKFFNSYDCTQA